MFSSWEKYLWLYNLMADLYCKAINVSYSWISRNATLKPPAWRQTFFGELRSQNGEQQPLPLSHSMSIMFKIRIFVNFYDSYRTSFMMSPDFFDNSSQEFFALSPARDAENTTAENREINSYWPIESQPQIRRLIAAQSLHDVIISGVANFEKVFVICVWLETLVEFIHAIQRG